MSLTPLFNYALFSAVDRSLQSSLSDARYAFINVAIDVLSAYKLVQSTGGATSLLTPSNLRLLPLFILALLKYVSVAIYCCHVYSQVTQYFLVCVLLGISRCMDA
jgi:hypothetical protein